jgi:hypothetical protein
MAWSLSFRDLSIFLTIPQFPEPKYSASWILPVFLYRNFFSGLLQYSKSNVGINIVCINSTLVKHQPAEKVT